MATYTILTTRAQEVGLKFSYDTYADKTQYPTQQAWFQYNINMGVSNPMYANQQAAMSQSFDTSFNTIPETSQPKARTDIEAVIIANGGTVVPPGPPGPPAIPANASLTRGLVPLAGGTTSNPVQIRGTDEVDDDTSGRDGEGDNPA